MRYDWDEAKSASNLTKHGVLFDACFGFEWELAWIQADLRLPYGEVRLRATGPIGNRAFVLVYTIRRTRLRVISLRRASDREYLRYVAYLAETHP